MKVDNVYVAFLKSDNEEHLLYKKSEGNFYYDLITKEKHHVDDIDFNTLIYLKDTIYTLYENMSKHNIKKLYNKDRKKLIDLMDLVIVDLNRVTNLEKIKLGNGYTEYKWDAKFLNRTILEKYTMHSYQDMRNKRIYLGEIANMFVNGCVYVSDGNDSNIKYLRYDNLNLGSIEKKKVLELAYKVSKGKKI